jgi:hypothetical protein
MSIDLYIIPTISNVITWGELLAKFLELLTPEEREPIGEPSLIKARSHDIAELSEKLLIYHYYSLSLAVPNTLSFGCFENTAVSLDELSFVEDYGRNLERASIQTIAQQWQAVGYTYEVTSGGGRSRWEPPLFVALSAALADLCQGYVIVMDSCFTLDIGIYSSQQFRPAKMTLTLRVDHSG